MNWKKSVGIIVGLMVIVFLVAFGITYVPKDKVVVRVQNDLLSLGNPTLMQWQRQGTFGSITIEPKFGNKEDFAYVMADVYEGDKLVYSTEICSISGRKDDSATIQLYYTKEKGYELGRIGGGAFYNPEPLPVKNEPMLGRSTILNDKATVIKNGEDVIVAVVYIGNSTYNIKTLTDDAFPEKLAKNQKTIIFKISYEVKGPND